jgi:hypothetical protein
VVVGFVKDGFYTCYPFNGDDNVYEIHSDALFKVCAHLPFEGYESIPNVDFLPAFPKKETIDNGELQELVLGFLEYHSKCRIGNIGMFMYPQEDGSHVIHNKEINRKVVDKYLEEYMGSYYPDLFECEHISKVVTMWSGKYIYKKT